MTTYHHYHIECLHDQGLAPRDETVADYHPLSTQEVIELLQAAIGLKDHADRSPHGATQGIASIQVRLTQGIPGMTCPRPYDDSVVCEKMNALDSAYVDWIQDPDTLFFKDAPMTEDTDIVVTLTRLMQE